jgi:DNA-binding NarL/FixJ family response regulator
MRIVLADHQSKVRFALRMLLVRQPGLEVVGEAATVEDLLALVDATHPDLLLLHWRLCEEMPELLATLTRDCPGLHVIALSVRQEACGPALDAGAEAFVCKMDPPEKLLAAIESVRLGHSHDKDGRHGQQGKRRGGTRRQPSAPGKAEERGSLKILGLGGADPEPLPQSGA